MLKINLMGPDPRNQDQLNSYVDYMSRLFTDGNPRNAELTQKDLKELGEEFETIGSGWSDDKIVFAEHSQKPVGVIKYCVVPDVDVAEIYNLFVNPDFRLNGIGNKLVEKVIEEARIADCRRIEVVVSKQAKVFYEKIGFKEHSIRYPGDMWFDLDCDNWFFNTGSRVH